MHQVILERWSRRDSVIHRRDARVKVGAAFLTLAVIATTPPAQPMVALGYALVLMAGLIVARLPIGGLLLRAAVVLPFAGTFAIISALAGDPQRSAALVAKSYLSAVTVLILVATTPMPRLLNAIESLGAPRMVVLVIQFLYRYLFVISEQAQHMRMASHCRGKSSRHTKRKRKSRFRAAAGALAVLFGRSYGRAEAIHRAMLARGFNGHFRPLGTAAMRPIDLLYLTVAGGLPIVVRIGIGRMF
jgi:cobalt/nickel transport system permease protein